MAKVEMIMPKMGESVAEATILKWLKSVGDKIEIDEAVLEIATDKVDSEVPSPVSGILSARLFEEGQVVQVGSVIAVINTEKESEKEVINTPVVNQKTETGFTVGNKKGVEKASTAFHEVKTSSNRFYSPLVKNIAEKEGISISELESIQGSGDNGRVTKKDILAYLPSHKGKISEKTTGTLHISQPSQPVTYTANGEVEIIEMDRMRKLIAEHMVMSKRTSPHVTSFIEVDVTNIVLWRDKIKNEFEKREKEKITYTPIFIEAVVKAIKNFPLINSSVEETKIILKKDINIGMATALPSGNLIVPVIKKADQMNIIGLTKSVNDLATRARNNKLGPDEIQGGTFTITNVGTFGNLMGTPIINQPQVAILATGAIKKKAVVIETAQGDMIGIRHMMFLSLSYDHRVVDGALGGSFLRKVADYMEGFEINRTI